MRRREGEQVDGVRYSMAYNEIVLLSLYIGEPRLAAVQLWVWREGGYLEEWPIRPVDAEIDSRF